VVVNLLDNAIRHSPNEQSVEVDLSRDASGFLVKIRNQGPALLPEDVERIFEPLIQAANNPHRRHHFGLGLAFCKLAMEAHGGRIWAESSLEAGNTFTFTLPPQCSAA
jgi:signal transduction histidine kinase